MHFALFHRRHWIVVATLFIFSPLLVASQGLSDFNGKLHSISEYSGNNKWLVVMLWASDCHVCNKEAHQYTKFHKKHLSSKDASVLGISLDGKSGLPEARHFIKKHAVNFPNLIAEGSVIKQMYQDLTGADWIGTPSFMVYGPSGELIGAQAGAIPTKVIEDFINRESEQKKSEKNI